MRIDLDVVLNDSRPFTTPLRPSEFTHTSENVVVVHLKGSLMQGPAASFFLDQIRSLVDRGVNHFVIDLLEAERIDNRGIGSLAAAYNSIRDVRGRIKYILASKELLSALSRNHLDRIFEIFQDEDSALASFCQVAD